MAIVRIPIEYLSKAGIEDGPFYLRAPIMKVRIRYDPDHGKGLGPRRANNWERVAALIDSGADLNYADPALLARIGCPVCKGATVQGATSIITSKSFVAHILCHPSKTQIETDIVATPLRANGRTFDLVLGTLFLQLGRLNLDFVREEFFFEKEEPLTY